MSSKFLQDILLFGDSRRSFSFHLKIWIFAITKMWIITVEHAMIPLKRSFLVANWHSSDMVIFLPAQMLTFIFSQPSMTSLTICPIQEKETTQMLPNKLQKSSWNADGLMRTKIKMNLDIMMASKKNQDLCCHSAFQE